MTGKKVIGILHISKTSRWQGGGRGKQHTDKSERGPVKGIKKTISHPELTLGDVHGWGVAR